MKRHLALPHFVTQMYFIYFRSCRWVSRLDFFGRSLPATTMERSVTEFVFFFFYFFKVFPGPFSYLRVPSAKSLIYQIPPCFIFFQTTAALGAGQSPATTFGGFKSLPFLRRCLLPTSARSLPCLFPAILGMEVATSFLSAVSVPRSLTNGAKTRKTTRLFPQRSADVTCFTGSCS